MPVTCSNIKKDTIGLSTNIGRAIGDWNCGSTESIVVKNVFVIDDLVDYLGSSLSIRMAESAYLSDVLVFKLRENKVSFLCLRHSDKIIQCQNIHIKRRYIIISFWRHKLLWSFMLSEKKKLTSLFLRYFWRCWKYFVMLFLNFYNLHLIFEVWLLPCVINTPSSHLCDFTFLTHFFYVAQSNFRIIF